MPRKRHAQGRPNAVVIPPDWQATHAAVMERTFDCTVDIGPTGGVPTWNAEAGATLTQPAAAVYSGPATITPIVEDTEHTADAEDIVQLRRYQVKIRHNVESIAIGHVVRVRAAPDPMLGGRRLRVTGIEKGSRRFSRILQAVEAD